MSQTTKGLVTRHTQSSTWSACLGERRSKDNNLKKLSAMLHELIDMRSLHYVNLVDLIFNLHRDDIVSIWNWLQAQNEYKQ